MSNELTVLPELTQNLFRHVFMLLPWFGRNSAPNKYEVDHYDRVVRIVKGLKNQKPL